MRLKPTSRWHGFSLLELLTVVAIVLVVTALAAPTMVRAIAQFRLRSAGDSIATLAQNARMLAVKNNSVYGVQLDEGGTRFTVVDAAGAAVNSTPEFDLPPNMTAAEWTSCPSPAPTPSPQAPPPQFTPRGLPCVWSGSQCSTFSGSTPVGFMYCFQQTRVLGDVGWLRITISPTGRIATQTYDGSSWN